MECTKVSETLQLKPRYSGRDEGMGEERHNEAEKSNPERIGNEMIHPAPQLPPFRTY